MKKIYFVILIIGSLLIQDAICQLGTFRKDVKLSEKLIFKGAGYITAPGTSSLTIHPNGSPTAYIGMGVAEGLGVGINGFECLTFKNSPYNMRGFTDDSTTNPLDSVHLLSARAIRRLIARGGGGGGVTPVDNILDWDATGSYYQPYASKQTGLNFYTGTTDPDGTTRLNLNGDFHATTLRSNNGVNEVTMSADASYPLYVSSSTLTSTMSITNSGTGLYGGAQTNGYGVQGVSAYGTALNIAQTDNSSNSITANLFSLSRSASGTGNVTGNIINITDNPTKSGTISGKILSATMGTTERISFNPRVTNGTTPAYLFDTHTDLTGNTPVFQVKDYGVSKFYINKDTSVFTNILKLNDSLYVPYLIASTRYSGLYYDSLYHSVKVDSVVLEAGIGLIDYLTPVDEVLLDTLHGEIAWMVERDGELVKDYSLIGNGKPSEIYFKIQYALEHAYRYISELEEEVENLERDMAEIKQLLKK